tara:strand:- start:256 stop:429 length:174 start_codon:yes stop_codon:yes gene_type:complete
MKKYLLFFLILVACSSNQNEVNKKPLNFNFSNDLSFKEFKLRLDEYANSSPYPDIDS